MPTVRAFCCVIFLMNMLSKSMSQVKQIEIGAGATFFAGDIPGKISDCYKISFLYNKNNKIGLKSCFATGMLAGNDNISDNSWKQNRNLNFASRFIEITEKMQFTLFSYKATGFNFFPSAGNRMPARSRAGRRSRSAG